MQQVIQRTNVAFTSEGWELTYPIFLPAAITNTRVENILV
jgi:hypothetical protein